MTEEWLNMSSKQLLSNWLSESSHRKWIVLIGSIFVFGAILTFYFVSPWIIRLLGLNPLSTRNHLLSTSIFSSSVLTFSLIVVYWSIGGIQERQAKTMEDQARLQEEVMRLQEKQLDLQNRPNLALRGLEIQTSEGPYLLGLSNVGNDVASELHLIVHLRVQKEDRLLSLEGDTKFNGAHFRPLPTPLRSESPRDVSRMGVMGGDLLEVDGSDTFFGNPQMMRADENDRDSWSSVPLHEVVEELDDFGAEHIDIQHSILFKSSTGKFHAKVIGQLRLMLEHERDPEQLEEMPEVFGISIGLGGSPDHGWDLNEIFERGNFTSGAFMAFVKEEEIISKLDNESPFPGIRLSTD